MDREGRHSFKRQVCSQAADTTGHGTVPRLTRDGETNSGRGYLTPADETPTTS
jgi:hypothetical protein